MGVGQSTAPSVDGILAAVTSVNALPYEDPLWDALLECEASGELEPGSNGAGPEHDRSKAADVDGDESQQPHTLMRELQRYGARFVANNMSSGNLQRLLLHAAASLLECQDSLGRARFVVFCAGRRLKSSPAGSWRAPLRTTKTWRTCAT